MPVARSSHWKERCHRSARVVNLFALRQVLTHSSLQKARLGIPRATGYAASALRSRLTVLWVLTGVASFKNGNTLRTCGTQKPVVEVAPTGHIV